MHDKLIDMLKIIYVEDYNMTDNVAGVLGKCDEFLMNPDGKPNPEVLQRVEWIKYKLAIYCSVKGRFAAAYRQTATGILTNTMNEKGWQPLQMPLGKTGSDNRNRDNNNQQQGNRP